MADQRCPTHPNQNCEFSEFSVFLVSAILCENFCGIVYVAFDLRSLTALPISEKILSTIIEPLRVNNYVGTTGRLVFWDLGSCSHLTSAFASNFKNANVKCEQGCTEKTWPATSLVVHKCL